MKSIWNKAFVVVILVLIAGGVALLDIYPYQPRSIIGWCLLFMLALPLWLFLEFLGNRFAGATFIKALSPVTRIVIGVVIGGGCILLGLWTLHFMKPFLIKQGL